MKIAIVVGHNARSQGASSKAPISMSEFKFNNLVADKMLELAEGSDLDLKKFNRVSGGGYSNEILRVYGEVEAWGARASMELHFNSTPGASGSLMLHSGSTNSKKLSDITQKHCLDTLGLRDRGSQQLNRGDRGYLSVVASSAWSILTEPFFGSSSSDCEKVDEIGIEGMAKMYLDALTEFAGVDEIQPAEIGRKGAEDDFLVKVDLKERGLSKTEFFSQNKEPLQQIVDAVNGRLVEDSHGETLHELTMLDVVCVANAEMGLKNDGKIDSKFTHSLGERGLLPLPSNIRYWNGQDSPENTQLVTLERNVKEFLLYLGKLKNSDVGSTFSEGAIYRDLFFVDDIESRPRSQMFILAAAVHGWFYSGLYSDDIPYLELVRKVAATEAQRDAIIPLLQRASYKKAQNEDGRKLLSNRIDNLINGIAIYEDIFE